MDLAFKESSSWDLTELDFDLLDDTSNNQNMEVFSTHPTSGKPNDQKHSIMSVSSKKQHISCLVDGCTADLTCCRDYHRRHRVCETHSKTPLVIIGGKDQRFCQQCSRVSDQLSELDRFHSVGEFDKVKRSCRKCLDGHNRRRRKPMPESIYGSFSTNHQGTKLLRFGGSSEDTLRLPRTEKLKQQVHVIVQQTTPSNPCMRFCSAKEIKFPFLLEFPERLVEPKAALSLLSKHTMNLPLRNVRDGDTNNHSEGLLQDESL